MPLMCALQALEFAITGLTTAGLSGLKQQLVSNATEAAVSAESEIPACKMSNMRACVAGRGYLGQFLASWQRHLLWHLLHDWCAAVRHVDQQVGSCAHG